MKQLIYFTAGWCPSCQNMKTTINQLKNQKNIQIAEIDVDYDANWTEKYNVKSVPTMVLLENGEEVRRSVGYKDVNQTNAFING